MKPFIFQCVYKQKSAVSPGLLGVATKVFLMSPPDGLTSHSHVDLA